MVKCESCGADLPESARFCSSCGAAVGKVVKEEIKVSSDDLVGKIKELLSEERIERSIDSLDVTRIIVKDQEGKTLLEIPAWAGIVGTALAPWLAALGVIAALATDCTIQVIRHG